MKILFLSDNVVFGIHPNHEEAENYEHINHVLFDGEAEIKPGYITVWNGNSVDYVLINDENVVPSPEDRITALESVNAELKATLDDMILNSPIPAMQAAIDDLILNGGTS